MDSSSPEGSTLPVAARSHQNFLRNEATHASEPEASAKSSLFRRFIRPSLKRKRRAAHFEGSMRPSLKRQRRAAYFEGASEPGGLPYEGPYLVLVICYQKQHEH
jgi:hypothetical protein